MFDCESTWPCGLPTPGRQYHTFQLTAHGQFLGCCSSRADFLRGEFRSFVFSNFRSGRFLHSADASWSLGVTSYGRSNLNKAEQQALAGGPVKEFLSTSLKGRRYIAWKRHGPASERGMCSSSTLSTCYLLSFASYFHKYDAWCKHISPWVG